MASTVINRPVHWSERSAKHASDGKDHGINSQILKDEIAKLDEKIATLEIQCQDKRELPEEERKGCGNLERDRLKWLKVQHQSLFRLDKEYALTVLCDQVMDCINEYSKQMTLRLRDLHSAQEFQDMLHALHDYADGMRKIDALNHLGDPVVQEQIEDKRNHLLRHERLQLAALEREHARIQKIASPMDQYNQEGEEEDEGETEAGIKVEELYSDIRHIQQILSPAPNELARDGNGDVKDAIFLKKAALFLMTKDVEDETKALSANKTWLEFEPTDKKGRFEFVGQAVQGCEHGLGTMSWVNGVEYRGEFRDGCTEGLGLEIYEDRSTYLGQFCNNTRHGLGVYVSPSGEEYSGEWVMGERQGLGIVTRQTRLNNNLQDIQEEVIEDVSPSVRLTGVVLHQPDKSVLWNDVNGVYQRSHEMCNGQPVYSRLTMPWAIWLSKVEPSDEEAARKCWCVGKKEMVGTESMFAYVETMGLGLEETGSRPWTVYSYKSNSWEPQIGIEVLRIEPSVAKEVMFVDQTVERDQLRRVRELPSDEADEHEIPHSRQDLSTKQALTCQSVKPCAVTQQLKEWSGDVLSEIDTKVEWQADQKVDDEAGTAEGPRPPSRICGKMLAKFDNGDIVEVLQNATLEKDLRNRIEHVVRVAMQKADAAQTLACQIRDEVNGLESRREDFDDIQPERASSLLKDKERNRTGGCSMDISSLTEMTVEQLKNALKERGLLTTGLKEELVERLEAFLGSENKQVKHTMQHVGKLWQEVYVNKLRRYRSCFKPKWLLMPHPKLRNQSPIRAIQSDEGRALLDQLLKGVGPSVAAKRLRRFWLRRNFDVWNKIIQPRVGGAVILQACLRRREQQIHMLELSRVFPEFERGVVQCGEDILSAKRLQLIDWGAQVMQSWLRRRTGQMLRDLMIQHLVSAKFLQNVLRCKFIAEKAKTFALAFKTVCAAQILQFYLRHKGGEHERTLHVLALQREKCCIIVLAALRRKRGQADMMRRILELERLQGAMILQAAVCREKHQRAAGCAKSAAKKLQYYLRHKGAESERRLNWERLLQELALQREKCCIILQAALRRKRGQEEGKRRIQEYERLESARTLQAALRRNRGQAEMKRRILELERLQGAMMLQAAVCREKHQRAAGCAKSAAKKLQCYLRHKGAESERRLNWERLLQELALQREKCCIILQAALRRKRGQAEMKRRILELERLQGAMMLQAAVCREKHQRAAGCAKSAAKKLQCYLRHKGAESERRLNWERLLQELALQREKCCIILQAALRRKRGQAEMKRRILELERLQGAMMLQAAVCREKHQRAAGCAKSAAKKLQCYLRHKGAESERRLNWLALRKEKSCVTLQARIRQAIIRVEAPDGLRDARRDYERHQKALKETKRVTRVLRFVRALPDDSFDDLFWQSMVPKMEIGDQGGLLVPQSVLCEIKEIHRIKVDFENATTKFDQASKSWGDVENMPRPLTPSRLLQAHQRLREALARVREMEQDAYIKAQAAAAAAAKDKLEATAAAKSKANEEECWRAKAELKMPILPPIEHLRTGRGRRDESGMGEPARASCKSQATVHLPGLRRKRVQLLPAGVSRNAPTIHGFLNVRQTQSTLNGGLVNNAEEKVKAWQKILPRTATLGKAALNAEMKSYKNDFPTPQAYHDFKKATNTGGVCTANYKHWRSLLSKTCTILEPTVLPTL